MSRDESAAATAPPMLELGEAIWLARDLVGMTQAELASRLRVSRPQVTNIEGGRYGASIATLEEIARVLHVKFCTDGWTWTVLDA